MPQCAAKSKQSGSQCKRSATAGFKVCSMHGGKTPSGMASPSYKDGRYSKVMPPALAERFSQASKDPELLSLVRLVAVLDSRLVETLSEIGKPGSNWDSVTKANHALKNAKIRQDTKAMGVALTELSMAVDAGVGEVERWKEIKDTIEGVRKLIDSIKKHQVQNEQIVTLIQMQVLFTGLARSVRKAFVGLMAQLHEEQDKKAAQKALRTVSEDFIRLTNINAGSQKLLTEVVQ